jgi:hypothetical protein
MMKVFALTAALTAVMVGGVVFTARAARVVVGVGGGGVAQPAKPAKKPTGKSAKSALTGEAARKEAERLVAEHVSEPRASLPETAAIRKLIGELGADSYKVREAASGKLAKYGGKALPELQKAAKSKDPEVSTRAEGIIETIKNQAGSREYERLAGLRRIKKVALEVIDAKIKDQQKLSATAKKQAAELMAKDKKDQALAALRRAKGSVSKALALAELRKRVEIDDPLDEIRALMKKGKHRDALTKLQARRRKLQQAGKLTPALQAKYQKLFMEIYRGMRAAK